MIDEIRRLIDSYSEWLREKTSVRQVDGWAEITTPYLDRHNDCLQIYARADEAGYLLTDDGYILHDLEMSGCELNTPKRKALFQQTLNGFGVALEEGRLETRASPESFGLRKHNLLQAMLAVNDLFYLASPSVVSLFYEDVVAWLDKNEVRYTPKVKFAGKSGYDHLFDFVVPRSRCAPERIVQTINRPDRSSAGHMAFSWVDTRQVREENSQAYAMLNDSGRNVSGDVLAALQSYEVRPVPWSDREAVAKELAA